MMMKIDIGSLVSVKGKNEKTKQRLTFNGFNDSLILTFSFVWFPGIVTVIVSLC